MLRAEHAILIHEILREDLNEKIKSLSKVFFFVLSTVFEEAISRKFLDFKASQQLKESMVCQNIKFRDGVRHKSEILSLIRLYITVYQKISL